MKFDIGCNRHPKYKAAGFSVPTCQACLILYWLKSDGYRGMDDTSQLLNLRKTRKKP